MTANKLSMEDLKDFPAMYDAVLRGTLKLENCKYSENGNIAKVSCKTTYEGKEVTVYQLYYIDTHKASEPKVA